MDARDREMEGWRRALDADRDRRADRNINYIAGFISGAGFVALVAIAQGWL